MVEDKYKDAVERLLEDTGLSKTELLEVLAKRYFTEKNPDDPDKLFSKFIHKKGKNEEEVDMAEVVKEREAEAKKSKKEWEARAYKKQDEKPEGFLK